MLALLPTAVQTHVVMVRISNEIDAWLGPHSLVLEAMCLEMKSHWETMSPVQRELYNRYRRQHLLHEVV